MRGPTSSIAVSSAWNGESVEHAVEGNRQRCAQAVENPFGALLAESREGGKLVVCERIQVGRVLGEAAAIEQGGRFLADAVNVHHAASYEVLYAALDLRSAAIDVGAYNRCLALYMAKRCAARGAHGDEFHGRC